MKRKILFLVISTIIISPFALFSIAGSSFASSNSLPLSCSTFTTAFNQLDGHTGSEPLGSSGINLISQPSISSTYGAKSESYLTDLQLTYTKHVFTKNVTCSPSTLPNLNSGATALFFPSSESISFKNNGNNTFTYNLDLTEFYSPVYSPGPTNSSSPTSGTGYNINKACGGNSVCITCLKHNNGNQSFQYIYTDFGCVNTTPSGLINFIYILAIVISSMLAFLTLLIGGFLIMTSSGDPDKINRGKTLVKNAIIGLIVIILAVVILGLIGSIFGITQIAL
ncbi:MAG: pilin [Patescibacteria group bacterium]